MTTSDKGQQLIKHYEGCKLTSYQDQRGIWTIGYGNCFYADGRPVKEGQTISQDEADKLFPAIMTKFELSVSRLLKVAVTQNQFDSLVSFAYNVGIGNLEKSQLLSRVNKADNSASTEFLKWNHTNGKVNIGLTARRQSEKFLFDFGLIRFFN